MSWLSEYVAELKARPEALAREPFGHEAPRGFAAALGRPRRGPLAVIAEIKFRSPSMGQLRASADVEHVAASYALHGATALSVLVDGPHFGGSLDHLARARAAVDLPLLAKGFLVRASDLRDARAAGADAVLLVAACLGAAELHRLHAQARDLGLDVLVEVHGEEDLAALEGLAAGLVGVNHRNLDTLAMDLDLSARLASRLPADAVRVAESGLESLADLARMAALGYQAALVGTRFMRHPEPGEELARLLEGRP